MGIKGEGHAMVSLLSMFIITYAYVAKGVVA